MEWLGHASRCQLIFSLNLKENTHGYPPQMCQRVVRYEGAMTLIAVNIVGLMMLIRYVSFPRFLPNYMLTYV